MKKLITVLLLSLFAIGTYADSESDIEKIFLKAMQGDAKSQYLYGILNHRLSDFEQEVWVKKSADQGYDEAIVLLATKEIDKGNYDSSLNLINEIKDQYPDRVYKYGFNRNIKLNDLYALATYLKNNPEFSLKGFGPIKSDDTTFYISREGDIVACAVFRGKAGLLQLDRNGNRINHDDVPFAYDYIIPIMHEFLVPEESSLFFEVSPYNYKIPLGEVEFGVIERNGKENCTNIYDSYIFLVPRVESDIQ